MRWPWSRQIKTETDPKAHEAMAVAEELYTAQEVRWVDVDRVTNRLAERRHRNRFAELVEEAIAARREQM